MFFYFFSPFLVKVWYQSQRRTLVGSEQLLTWNGCFIFSMDGGLTGGSSGSSDSHQINLNTASLPKDSTNGCFIFFSTLCKPHFLCPLIAILCPRTHNPHTQSFRRRNTLGSSLSHLNCWLTDGNVPWKTLTVPLLPRNLNKLSVNLRILEVLIQCWGWMDGWMHGLYIPGFV